MGRFYWQLLVTHTEMCHTIHTEHTRICAIQMESIFIQNVLKNLKGFCSGFRACFGFLFTVLHCRMNSEHRKCMVMASLEKYIKVDSILLSRNSTSDFEHSFVLRCMRKTPKHKMFDSIIH